LAAGDFGYDPHLPVLTCTAFRTLSPVIRASAIVLLSCVFVASCDDSGQELMVEELRALRQDLQGRAVPTAPGAGLGEALAPMAKAMDRLLEEQDDTRRRQASLADDMGVLARALIARPEQDPGAAPVQDPEAPSRAELDAVLARLGSLEQELAAKERENAEVQEMLRGALESTSLQLEAFLQRVERLNAPGATPANPAGDASAQPAGSQPGGANPAGANPAGAGEPQPANPSGGGGDAPAEGAARGALDEALSRLRSDNQLQWLVVVGVVVLLWSLGRVFSRGESSAVADDAESRTLDAALSADEALGVAAGAQAVLVEPPLQSPAETPAESPAEPIPEEAPTESIAEEVPPAETPPEEPLAETPQPERTVVAPAAAAPIEEHAAVPFEAVPFEDLEPPEEPQAAKPVAEPAPAPPAMDVARAEPAPEPKRPAPSTDKHWAWLTDSDGVFEIPLGDGEEDEVVPTRRFGADVDDEGDDDDFLVLWDDPKAEPPVEPEAHPEADRSPLVSEISAEEKDEHDTGDEHEDEHEPDEDDGFADVTLERPVLIALDDEAKASADTALSPQPAAPADDHGLAKLCVPGVDHRSAAVHLRAVVAGEAWVVQSPAPEVRSQDGLLEASLRFLPETPAGERTRILARARKALL